MAQIAAHCRTLGQVNALLTIIIPQQDPVGCGLGQHGAFQVETMTATAGIGILLVEILMLQVPPRAVDVVHTVGAIEG